VLPGSSVPVTFNYFIIESPSCPGCIDQIQVGLSGGLPQGCVYDGQPGAANGVTGSASINLVAPTAPGTYYIGLSRSEQFSCLTNNWYTSVPSSTFYLGTITVSGFGGAYQM